MSIEQDYLDRHPASAALHRRASRVLPSGITHDSRHQRPFPIYIERAAGSRKWDVDGNELVDYVMGHGALLLGHSHPVVTGAVATQVQRGTHFGASHEAEVRWAERVVELVPSAEVVRFTSSGTEATLMALRLARAASGRPAIIKFERHFHGWHDYVITSSKYEGAAPAGVPGSLLESVVVLPPESHVVRETLAARDDVGAVIVEASGASMGAFPLPPGFLADLREMTAERGRLLIFDEVVTGFRWSPGGVQAREGITPDLTALAKILAGGLPGGAVAGRRDLMEQLSFPEPGVKKDKVGHPGTFNANPLSAAAGAACLAEVADGTYQERAEATARTLAAAMNAALAERSIPGAVYGQASCLKILIAGEDVPDARLYSANEMPLAVLEAGMNSEVQRLLNLAMINRGVQVFGNSMIVSGVHDQADVDRTIGAWTESLDALRAEGKV